MMVDVPLLIHVGYHKTATTWMQHQLFLPEHGYRQLFGHQEVFDLFVRPHGLVFDPSPVRDAVDAASGAMQAGETAVISSEILSGQPFYGGRESDVFARRLSQVAPSAKILISIRNQMRILPSVYMQYLSRGGTMDYLQFFEDKPDIQYFRFSSEHFEYHRLVELYQKLFGPDRVFVLTQESLTNNPGKSLTHLARFTGNTVFTELDPQARRVVGESYPEYAAPILRRINHVQSSTLNPRPIISLGRTPKGLYKIAGFPLKKPPLSTFLQKFKPVSSYVAKRFSNHFDESNQELKRILNPDVVLAGYPGIDA